MSTKLVVLEQEHPQDLQFYRETLGRESLPVEVITAASATDAIRDCAGASVLVAKAHSVPQALVDAMPHLEWIQALTTGIDHLASLRLPTNVIITSARGVHGPQMSELALLLMMALSRDLPRMLRNQIEARWERWPQRLLLGKTAVLVGVGAISEELAGRCKAFGMRVIGISAARSQTSGFDEIHPREALAQIARQADFLVALVPYSTETHHLIDASVIGNLPRHACLVNVARGNVVDEGALIEALAQKRIAGAGLDVFAQEPPARDNPLWTLPNVIMTPHIGGMSDTYAQQLAPLLIDNLRKFLGGRRAEMRNLVRFP